MGGIPEHTGGVPLHDPFVKHTLIDIPINLKPSLQVYLAGLASVVLNTNTSPLSGGSKVPQSTATEKRERERERKK